MAAHFTSSARKAVQIRRAQWTEWQFASTRAESLESRTRQRHPRTHECPPTLITARPAWKLTWEFKMSHDRREMIIEVTTTYMPKIN